MKRTTFQKQNRKTAAHSVAPSPHPSVARSLSFSPSLTRRELLLFLLVLVLGITLRLVAFSRSAVEHFDEGVYASNIYFGPPDFAYPLQRFYAPSLLPALIETGVILGLRPNVAAILPSFLAGCGTIAALWWLGRSWFGPAVGLTAAALVAFSDFHILFSTAALTDELLGLWLVLAVDAIARSLLRGDLRWAVGAGIFTGLAWWTKYNGWLPLAIELAGICVLLCLSPPQRNRFNSLLGCFAVTSVVAVAVWSPYYFSLQSQGGYSPIAANHAKYFVGLSGWLDAASRQLANGDAIATGLSALGILIALSLPALLPNRRLPDRFFHFALAAVLSLTAFWFSSFALIVALSLIGLVNALVAAASKVQRHLADEVIESVANENGQSNDAAILGIALLAAWWLGMFIMTPCYSPYARLGLPFTLAAYLAVPLFAISAWISTSSSKNRPHVKGWTPFVVQLALVMAFAGFAANLPRADMDFSRDRRGLLAIAREIHADVEATSPRVVYVYGEPALFLQLRAAGEELIAPVQDISTSPTSVEGKTVATFFIAGPNTQQDADFQRNWQAAQQKWQLIHTYDYRPSPLVWLDLQDPRSQSHTLDSAVKLYELQVTNDHD